MHSSHMQPELQFCTPAYPFAVLQSTFILPSHTSSPQIKPSPQTGGSTAQTEEHPSLSATFPSSHTSPVSRTLSPHTGTFEQSRLKGSVGTKPAPQTPSTHPNPPSHCSPSSRIPSPITFPVNSGLKEINKIPANSKTKTKT